MIYNDEIILNTSQSLEIIDITDKICEIIDRCPVTSGIVNIQSMHTTSSIVVNENESGLKSDFVKCISSIIPNFEYEHDLIDNNARSHLMSMISNPSVSLNFMDKRLSLGTWQSVFFVEFDGPRHNRKISIMVIGK